NPEGRIFLPGRGGLDVSGKTLAWTRERILKIVAEQYTGVHAEVRIVQLRTFKVFVSGEVKVPGAVNANSAMRASEVLAQLERLRGASRRNVVVRHADGSTSPVDLDRFERRGRSDPNPTLVGGDLIVVPHRL